MGTGRNDKGILFAGGIILLIGQGGEGLVETGTGIEGQEAIGIAGAAGVGPGLPVIRFR